MLVDSTSHTKNNQMMICAGANVAGGLCVTVALAAIAAMVVKATLTVGVLAAMVTPIGWVTLGVVLGVAAVAAVVFFIIAYRAGKKPEGIAPQGNNLNPLESNVQIARRAVQEYQHYLCSDAVTFARCCPRNKPYNEEEKRKYLAQHQMDVDLKIEASANQIAGFMGAKAKNGQYATRKSLEVVSNLMDKAHSGLCTTFAMAAAHKILKSCPNARVEIAVHEKNLGSHCLCFLDRKGAPQDPRQIYQGTLSDDTIIVDEWAASLGFGDGVFTVGNYPFRPMLSNLRFCFDSSVPERTDS